MAWVPVAGPGKMTVWVMLRYSECRTGILTGCCHTDGAQELAGADSEDGGRIRSQAEAGIRQTEAVQTWQAEDGVRPQVKGDNERSGQALKTQKVGNQSQITEADNHSPKFCITLKWF